MTASTNSSKHSSSRFFVAQLAQMPQSIGRGTIELVAADLDAASSLAHVERPSDGTTGAKLDNWLADIAGSGTGSPVNVVLPEAVSPGRLAQANEVAVELGWSVSNVHQFIEYSNPPDVFTVLTGSFSGQDITSAVGRQTNDIWSIGADDYGFDVNSVSPARRLGESVRFALHGDRLAVGRATPIVEAWKRLGGDGAKTLADDPALLAVAEALDATNAYAADLLEEDFSAGVGNRSPTKVAEVGGGPSLGIFTAAGIRLLVDSGLPKGVPVYAYPDGNAASSGADGLRQLLTSGRSEVNAKPWSDQLANPKITVDGSIVSATFGFHDMAPASYWSTALAHDNLLTSAR